MKGNTDTQWVKPHNLAFLVPAELNIHIHFSFRLCFSLSLETLQNLFSEIFINLGVGQGVGQILIFTQLFCESFTLNGFKCQNPYKLHSFSVVIMLKINK